MILHCETTYCCRMTLPSTSIGNANEGLQFYQTRSHAITLPNTLLAICLEKLQGISRLPRVVPTPNSQNGRQDPPNSDARKSTDHQSEQRLCRETCRSLLCGENQRCLYTETCRGDVDNRIPGKHHSTVQNEDTNRK